MGLTGRSGPSAGLVGGHLVRVGTAIAVLSAILVYNANVAEVKGRATVIDGDTLRIAGIKVRLNGIDAPEFGQSGYRAAARELQRLIAEQSHVACPANGAMIGMSACVS